MNNKYYGKFVCRLTINYQNSNLREILSKIVCHYPGIFYSLQRIKERIHVYFQDLEQAMLFRLMHSDEIKEIVIK